MIFSHHPYAFKFHDTEFSELLPNQRIKMTNLNIWPKNHEKRAYDIFKICHLCAVVFLICRENCGTKVSCFKIPRRSALIFISILPSAFTYIALHDVLFILSYQTLSLFLQPFYQTSAYLTNFLFALVLNFQCPTAQLQFYKTEKNALSLSSSVLIDRK